MEHLFKLKKEGKCVGYMQLQHHNKTLWYLGILWRYSRDGKTKWTGQKARWSVFDTAHPFVTKDKNGKDVFAGDKVKYQKDIGGKTGNYIVEWYAPKAGYILSGIDKEVELWNRDWMPEYSELIEDKENE